MNRTNVIIIVLDTMRAKDMSCYGYDRITTPNITDFGNDSIFYGNAFSPAIWTVPSHASLFTGTYPSVHGALNLHRYLDEKLMTLAEVLGLSGYDTLSFSNNGFISIKDFGLSRGFKISEGQPYPKRKISRVMPNFVKWAKGAIDCGAGVTNNYVKSFINRREKTDKPFFMFLNYMEAHAPYKNIPKNYLKLFVDQAAKQRVKMVNQDRQKYLTRSINMNEEDFMLLRMLYNAQISYLDYKISELLDFFKQNDIYDNSLILLTSDHGDMIGEHNLMHHSYCIYDELIKIPMILKLPDTINQGKKIDNQVSLMNVPATIMEILGIKNETFLNQVQEKSLPIKNDAVEYTHVFSECERPKNEFINTYPDFDFSVYDKHFLTVRSKQYKYIWASDKKHELYNIQNDPNEQFNLISEKAELAKNLEEKLFLWYDSFEKVNGEKEKDMDLDENVKEKLKALGYF